MTPSANQCPTVGELEDCLDPLEVPSSELSEHLEVCQTCRQTLEFMAGDEQTWIDAERSLSTTQDAGARRVAQSVCALSVEGAAHHTRDPLQEHEVEQLRSLLEPACHPELLGRIGRYELEQLVGRGGMGLVFRAFDTELQRVVAVKTLAIHLIPIESARARFIRESRASASLIHPHVVPVHDVITEGPVPAIVLQFVAGPTLEDSIRSSGPLPWREAVRLAIQLADALDAAHASGLVHRDIKPGNVLLEADGTRALLTDFGLVRALDDATLTRSGMLAGTPDYMSPEQARGASVGTTSDLFSFGSLLYAMIVGHPPFHAPDPMAVMNRICHQPHSPAIACQPQIPVALSQLIDQLLDKNPARRLGDAKELKQELILLLSGKKKRRPMRRVTQSVLALVVAAACLLIAIPLGIMLDRLNRNTHAVGPGLYVQPQPAGESTAESTAGFDAIFNGTALDQNIESVSQAMRDLESIDAWPQSPIPSTPTMHEFDRAIQTTHAALTRLENEIDFPWPGNDGESAKNNN